MELVPLATTGVTPITHAAPSKDQRSAMALKYGDIPNSTIVLQFRQR